MKANNNSITMFLFVVFVIMSGPLWAQFTGGLGTQASPYLVETAEQLHQVRLYPTAYFLQNADINLDLAPYNSGPGWQAIGEPDTPFSGNFDGNGYQIAGLYINRPQADYQGLFGYISNAALLNMQLSDAQIVGNDYVAALSGSALTSIIANCSVQAEITGAEITGGLIGSLAMNSQLSHSSALVQISGDFATGALCGYAKGYSEISSCVSRGSVTGNIAAGGLIGILGGSFLSKSYSTAAVSASSSTGGLLGENDTQSTVQECYSIGSVSGVNDVGGLIGRNLDSTVSQSYWNTQSSGLSYSAAGEGRSSQDMSYPFAADTYQNWDFAESWSWDEDYNGGYPYLTWEYTAPLVLDLMVESFSGPTLLGVNLQAAYTLQVINTGEAIIESFEAKLFKQSGELLSSQILGPIQPEEIFSVQLHWTPTAAYEGSVYAVVELEDDINPDDNQSQQIAVIVSDEIQAATIGNEDTTARYPLDFYWKASVFETIYYADELGFNGMIFNLEFYNSFSEELPNMPIKIWLGESSQTELTEAWIPSTQLQLVYDGPVDFPMGENAISITLDSPFSYQSGNLVMLVERPLDENYYGSQNLFYVQSSSTQRSRSYHSDVEVLDLENPNAPGSWISEYPRCTFRFMGQAYQAAPTELSLEYFPDQSRLALSWLPPETGYPLLYKVYRNEEPYAETILPYFEDNELSPGETYSYYVCAVYATGESEPSNVVSQEIEISSPLAYIPDDNFRMAINNELGQGADYQPTIADLESIIYVEAPDQGIVSLEGAQHLINMQGLYLDSNQISELSPISNLTQLQSLDLNYNQISELSPLSNLTLLEILYLTDNQISELDALSNMTLLRALYLNNNQITELGPLSNMTLLERLYLYDNQITELSPVSTLANLQRLYLANNQVSELSPISSLTNLQGLTLSSNQISELSPLVGLSNLQWLSLAYNQINDASPLSSLISLQDLDLSANQISDIWPLAGLSNLNEFDLEANPLSYESMLLSQSWSLPYTASTYEPLSPCYPDPERNGTDIALNSGLFWQANYEYQTAEYEVYLGASPQSLSYLGYGYLMDETGYTFDTTLEPLTEYYWRVKAVEDTTEIWSGMWSFTTGETVLMAEIGVEPAFVYEELNLEESSELQITISNTGNIPLDWESEIIFGRSIRTGQDRTLSISLEPAFGTIAPSSFVNCLLSFSPADTLGTYSYEIQLSSNDPENPLLIVPVEYQVFSPLAYIPDDNFRMAINSELEQPEDYQPTIADLESLNGRLSATSRGIVSLEGAQHLINLPELILHYNQISDLSPLSNLNNLQYLILFYNQISDLGPLSNLSNLQILDLSSNQVSDLSPLSNLSNLEGLSLDYNQISDLGPLSNLSNLLELYLEDNQFSDLSTLANLSNLQYLNLGSNQISDLSTLANLNNLQYLNLGSNQISDLSTLANLSNLNNLILENNIISDISALANLSNLHYLNLKSNQISGLNSLTNLINLGSLNLQNNQISDLGPLSNLNNLDWLWLNENQISDLSPLAGYTLANSTLQGCFSTGTASSSTDYAGGITGSAAYTASILSCYSHSAVSGISYVGGLIGETDGATLSDCYSTGAVTGTTNAGGLVGYNTGNSIAENCYWNTDTSAMSVSVFGSGRSTNAMTYPYAINTYETWDFTDTWAADLEHEINGGYPYLQWHAPAPESYPPRFVQAELELSDARLIWYSPLVGQADSYQVHRLSPGQEENEALWTLVASAAPDTIFFDTEWQALPDDSYKWAVKARYANDLSAAAFSNELEKSSSNRAPQVLNVHASQRDDDSMMIDIFYDVYDPDGDALTISLEVSADDGSTWDLSCLEILPDSELGAGILSGTDKHIAWDAAAEHPNLLYGNNFRFRITADDGIGNMPENFVLVEGGTFNNGTSDVTLSSFYMDKYELTQAEYQAVMGTNPSHFGGNPNHPVEQVSWFNAIEYCNRRSLQEGLTPCYSYSSYGTNPDDWPSGWNTSSSNHSNVVCNWTANGYRLPTEAEWMFAAKGGNPSQGYTYSGSNTIGNVAWYNSNSGSTTHTVGSKAPNELGLYDLSGNVWEWTWDIYGSYPSASQTNPTGANSGSNRVFRGGSWDVSAGFCTVSDRGGADATYSDSIIGFRCVRVSF